MNTAATTPVEDKNTRPYRQWTWWEWVHQNLCTLGAYALFSIEACSKGFSAPRRWGELWSHMEFIGNRSVFIVLFTGAFTGLAFTFQIYRGFSLINAANLVGPTVGLGIVRELAPVLVGLIISARAGGAMVARLGTMRVGEQIDAIQVMGIDPINYLISPRILASVVCLPLMCGLFIFVAMGCAYWLCTQSLGLDSAVFMDKIEYWLELRDLREAFVKSAVFGFGLSTICTFRGFYVTGGAKGVGEATNTAVVQSMVFIIVSNYFISNWLLMLFGASGRGF